MASLIPVGCEAEGSEKGNEVGLKNLRSTGLLGSIHQISVMSFQATLRFWMEVFYQGDTDSIYPPAGEKTQIIFFGIMPLTAWHLYVGVGETRQLKIFLLWN